MALLMEMWTRLGDRIALQYGGSEAHKKVDKGAGADKSTRSRTRGAEVLTSVRRYYSNSFTDHLKQDSINLFLGHFRVGRDYLRARHTATRKHLWEQDTTIGDFFLHNRAVPDGPTRLQVLTD